MIQWGYYCFQTLIVTIIEPFIFVYLTWGVSIRVEICQISVFGTDDTEQGGMADKMRVGLPSISLHSDLEFGLDH